MAKAPKNEPEPRSGLFEAVVNRDGLQACFAEVVTTYERMLYRICFRYAADAEEARDAVQEVFLDAWRGWSRRPVDRSVSEWLRRLAVRGGRSMARKRSRRRGLFRRWLATSPGPAPEADVGAQMTDRETVARVRKGLAALPEAERLALEMKVIEGSTYEEVAEGLGVSRATAARILARATDALLERVGGDA